ncbi:translocation/assembly module TamB domain-containing protein [Polaribacter sp. PL03]|uniref:translocation/assembly module TamB domain-containing protein n=1 Tax=Polaribacter sp. PL03 TaxID=3088353 RepID=UPI0029CBA31D|nr:translocation/assembly module TamB domain-containing protein [Polaribacter sp. PL03]MDX6747782.1 translocation/assembly module TamB domain-containing protein [Polaribacter sp. PL03]
MQTKLGNYATNKINEDFGTNLSIGKVNLSFLGSIVLKDVEIRDHHKDTLIFVKKLSTSLLNAKKVLNSELLFDAITLEDGYYYMKTYKGEADDNMAIFIDSFKSDTPKDSLASPFTLKADNVYVENLDFKLINENNKTPLSFSATNIGGNAQDLAIIGADFSTNARGLYFRTNQGLQVTNLTTNYKFTKTAMNFDNTKLETESSSVIGNILFTYKREDLINFNDKVNITANFEKSTLKVQDLKKFYKELNGSDVISFSGKMKGKLNNFDLNNLNLSTQKGIKLKGNLSFKNVVNTERGFVFNGDLTNLTATYSELKNILPNLLGKNLPSEFGKLGQFSIRGKINVTPSKMKATVDLQSQIGSVISDLEINNIDEIDTAAYIGDVELLDFNIGKFFNDPLFGKVSLKGAVNGSGFKLENINTKFVGNISELNFNSYTYKNIIANGQYQNNKFDGDLVIDDTNFKMKFNGLADLSSEVQKFDFKSDISYLNLKETNLFTRDTISIVKGKIELDIEGNTLDDIVGKAIFKNVLYTNQKKEYSFKEFTVTSSLKDSIKTIDVASKDIAQGYITGKFSFSELPKVAQNALGSIYTNYKPYEVASNQFLDFNFTVYNQIVNVFFPKVSIDDKTKIKGKINSDKDLFRLSFNSPRIDAYGTEVKVISLRTDNSNPLYNTSLTADEVHTEYYNISKLNLLNRTENDTLYFKSIFKGGDKKNEDFNLDFFYTFNPEGKSVLGFEKSSFIFKENTWHINPDEKNTDKITFDLKTNEFKFSQFKLISGEQKVQFIGDLKGTEDKILLADFTKVKLQSFLPVIDSLALKGALSGHLDFVQTKGTYAPEGSLTVRDFEVNDFKQGDLFINVKGENSYEKYNVDLSIENKDVKSIAASGVLDFSAKRPIIDLNVFLEEFKLDAFSPLGQDVLSSLRGTASGDFTLRGFLSNPDMEGVLRLKNAGLKFPYLNVDYDFEGESVITLQQQSFILEDFKLLDTKNKTKGILKGDISHFNFKKWFLRLKIESDNLMVLDTENTEEALYYGTAFIDGSADIFGLTDRLTIEFNAKTMPGTIFVLPLKDVETVDSYSLIHFKSDETKVKERQKEIALEALKGLTLKIDLEVTKDAIAQVVIDEVYGSQLSGRGSGNLQIEINTRGKFKMFGDYIVDNGVYDFKYGGFVNKPFVIQKGGTVSWNGNPADANLDVTAVYKAKANPGVLLENFNSNRNIEVDLVARITGGLFDSKQELDIQLTNVDPTIANELEFILNDNNVNEKTTQFISLLAFGNFANPDKVNFDANATITNTASSAIAAAFSSLLNSPDSKFQLGVDYQQGQSNSDLDRLNTDNQVDLSVSTQVSERVVINGKVGVPIGTQTQSSVVGEVKVEVLLNKEGSFRGIIFNRQNEIQYTTEDQGYTQGIGLSYQVNFNTLSGLLKKLGLKKKKNLIKRKSTSKDTIKTKLKKLDDFGGN